MSPHSAARPYREQIAELLANGWRFACLYGDRHGAVHTVLTNNEGRTTIETAPATGAPVASIVDLAPAAGWDEREAHDLHGIAFDGHDPLRPLVPHQTDPEDWTVPLTGDDAYHVTVGPIHAGIIESGHFRFHVVGDRILHLDTRHFYKHRGLERAAEGNTPAAGLAYAARACAACTIANTVAYARACEEAMGLRASRELARVRAILAELERVWSHLNDIGAICAGVGLAAGNSYFATLTETARRLNATLTGHRFLFRTVAVGGSDLEIDGGEIGTARTQLETLRSGAEVGWRELLFNVSFEDRLPNVGVVGADAAVELGASGPAARACGLVDDVRANSSELAYGDFAPVVTERPAGDVQARLEQRMTELRQSFDLLDDLLNRPVAPSQAEHSHDPLSRGVGRVESPRGATVCVVELRRGRVERLHLRTGSYANWPVVAHAARNNLLPDFPLINKSFELCYACVDR